MLHTLSHVVGQDGPIAQAAEVALSRLPAVGLDLEEFAGWLELVVHQEERGLGPAVFQAQAEEIGTVRRPRRRRDERVLVGLQLGSPRAVGTELAQCDAVVDRVGVESAGEVVVPGDKVRNLPKSRSALEIKSFSRILSATNPWTRSSARSGAIPFAQIRWARSAGR